MPREPLHIKEFSLGQIDEPDPRDIPLGAGVTCTNCDPNSYGILRGIFQAGSAFVGTTEVSNSEWIVRDDATRDLVYTDGSNIKTLLDFYGTPSAGNTISGAGYSFTPQNKKVFIGMGTSTAPKVALRIPAAKFNGLIAQTVANGTDDLIIDSSEYDGTADTYYVKVTSTTAVSGSYDSVSDGGGGAALFKVNAGHGLEGYGGQLITISGSSVSSYDNNGRTLRIVIQNDLQFFVFDEDANSYVQENGTATGNYTTTAADNCTWQWSTDDINYYPTGGYLAEEWGKISTHGLKARFVEADGKVLNDKWTITFSSANTETLYIEDAECYSYETNNVDDTFYIQIQCSGGEYADEGVFTETKKYFYGWSIIYDKFEESPVAYRGKGADLTSFSTTIPIQNVNINFKVTTTSLPKRVTGFNLWGAEANDTDAEAPETEFSYITSFNLDGSRQSSNTYTFKLKDVGARGLTYKNHTGIEEVAESTSVKHTLSATVNNRMYVANCAREGVNNASNMVFRSLPFKYSSFDWINEQLPLPTTPTALIAFRRQLLAFDESRLYIIEPQTFSITQQFNVGCPYSQGIAITEEAVYWGDNNAIYEYRGDEPIDISTAKIRSTYQGLFSYTNFNGLKAVYDAELKTILFCCRNSTNIDALSYHILNKRWDVFVLGANTSNNWGVFAGKSGESYGSNHVATAANFSSVARRSWTWYGGIMDFGSPGEDKVFYILRVDGTVGTIQFKVDGGATTTVTSGEEIKVGGTWAKGKRLQILLTATATTDIAYSVVVFYRRLGLR